MSEPFLAEIRMVGFNFAPKGWAFCDGQILPINQNQALFSLLGTTYGGDGQTSFALPDLRGRTPVHFGSSGGPDHPLGQKSGEQSHTLSAQEMPAHSHSLSATGDQATSHLPDGQVFAQSREPAYHAPGEPVGLNSSMLAGVGGGQAHENMQPFLVVNFCIALQGLFPSRD